MSWPETYQSGYVQKRQWKIVWSSFINFPWTVSFLLIIPCQMSDTRDRESQGCSQDPVCSLSDIVLFPPSYEDLGDCFLTESHQHSKPLVHGVPLLIVWHGCRRQAPRCAWVINSATTVSNALKTKQWQPELCSQVNWAGVPSIGDGCPVMVVSCLLGQEEYCSPLPGSQIALLASRLMGHHCGSCKVLTCCSHYQVGETKASSCITLDKTCGFVSSGSESSLLEDLLS